MGRRNQIVKEQFANESARRVLGYNGSGVPELKGDSDIVGTVIALLLSSVDRNNRFELKDWNGASNVSGLSGSWGYSDPFIPLNSSMLILAMVDGIAQDYSEGYGAVIVSKWIRGGSGAAVQVGSTTKLFEQKSQAGATAGFGNVGLGSLYVNFDSGQLVKTYNWQINAIYQLRKYA
jgi:hypothetical protein